MSGRASWRKRTYEEGRNIALCHPANLVSNIPKHLLHDRLRPTLYLCLLLGRYKPPMTERYPISDAISAGMSTEL